MYTSYFGLKENPFNLTPDPRYLFLSNHHREALDHLLYGINERKGFVVISGGIGTGKTTLCRVLLNRLDNSTKSALILNSFLSDTELLAAINQEFGIDSGPPLESRKQYSDSLNEFLLENFSSGGNAVLLIDEAQNLSHKVLEQIRMLSNLETEREKLLQIVFVGQPELKELFAAPALRQLSERIMVRYELRPLDQKDVQGYIEHRLTIGGAQGGLRFTDGAFKAVYEYSRGNPRRINAVCDRALLVAYAKDEFAVSKGTVLKAIGDIKGSVVPEYGAVDGRGKKIAFLSISLAILIIVSGFIVWTHRDDISTFFDRHEMVSKSSQDIQRASLFLDEQSSFLYLFRLFKEKKATDDNGGDSNQVVIFSYYTGPENLSIFKKPFIVLSAKSKTRNRFSGDEMHKPVSFPLYFVIRSVAGNGAVLVDANGEDRHVAVDFLKDKWGGKVSWIYPYENKSTDLVRGVSGQEVTEVQKTLKDIGYLVKTTGNYDELTFRAVMKLQESVGLVPDGIVGPRTKALFYQIRN